MGYKTNKKKQKQKQPVEHEQEKQPSAEKEEKQPSAEKKEKQKQVVVYEEDYIPIKTLTEEYGIDEETVKALQEVGIWNTLLFTANKSLLAGVKGLPEQMYDPILEAIDKIMVSLTSEVKDFTQNIIASMEVMYNGSPKEVVKKLIRATQECVRDNYTLDEMQHTMSEKFRQPFTATNSMYNHFFLGKRGYKAYKQLASIRSAQRKAEQKVKQASAEQKVKQASAEQKVKQASAEQKVKQAVKKELKQPIDNEEDCIETSLSQKEKQTAESLLPALSQQVITSQKAMMDAFAFQQKMVASIMNLNRDAATNEDLESFRDGVGERLESLGKAVVVDLADAIQNELTSATTLLSRKAEKIINSKVKAALNKLDIAFKEKVDIECEARVANVFPGTKERMAMQLVEEEYEECFASTGAASFLWLLTKVRPERLPELQLTKRTLRKLVLRLTMNVTRNDVGLDIDVYRSWFHAALELLFSTDHEIPDHLMERISVALDHVVKNA